MFNQQRYEIAKETIQAFKADTHLTDIKILLTEEEAKRLNDEEPQLFEGLTFGFDINQNSKSSTLKPYSVCRL